MKRISCSRTSRSPTPPRCSGGATIGSVGVSTRSSPSSAASICSRYSARSRSARSTSESRTARHFSTLILHVLAVGVAVLGEELPVDVRDLAHEDRVGRVVDQRQLDRAAPREAGGRLLDTRPHERIGRVRPGDADLELLERLELDGLVRGCERAEHPLAPRHVDGQRPRRVEARRERPAALERHEPVGRLVADDAAAGGGDPDRAGRVGAERRVGEPGRERRRRAAARPTRDPAGKARDWGRRRSAGSPTSCRRRTRAGSSCRRSRSRRPRAAAPPPRSARARGRRRRPSRRSSRARRCRTGP